jgi:tyrosyl-tRNA synthetase
VKSRLEREDVGISFTEFSYMLLQAYDFLRLYQDHDCSLQLGGSDQWGNITMGTELIRKVTGGQAAGLTSPLVTKADGTKFGKSEGGTEKVWLDANLTSPFAFHQFLLNTDDATTSTLLRFFTFLSHDEILELEEATSSRPQERRAQRAIANAIVSMVHGDEAQRAAERAGEALFAESIAELDETLLLDVVADAPSSTWSRAELLAGVDPVDLLVRCELASSKAEARRFLDQGGVYINNVRLDATDVVSMTKSLHDKYLVVRRGRRALHLVVAGQ